MTGEGRRLAEQLHDRAVEERRRVFAGFSPEQLHGLTDALRRIDDNVRPSLIGSND